MGNRRGITAALVALAAFAGGGAGAQDRPVRVGVLTDMTSFAADNGGAGSVAAARMAVEEFGGRALGRTIEILAADMQAKPDIAAAVARRWFDAEGVDVITDLPVSSVGLAVQDVARERKKALLISGSVTNALTGERCSPYTVHWADDTHALAAGTARAILADGGKDWFFVAADYAFGAAMERAARDVIEAGGGRVVGGVRHPIDAGDLSSFLLTAQASGARVIGLANTGPDFINAVKQASEFGLTQGGQRLAGFLVFVADVHALGLEAAQGLLITEDFYWDQNARTRSFSERFFTIRGRMPTKEQANTYNAVLHWLRAVEASGTTEAATVIPRMKASPVDQFGSAASIREDGRVLYDLTLWRVKTPAESKGPWDYYAPVRRVPAAEAFLPMEGGGCPFVEGGTGVRP